MNMRILSNQKGSLYIIQTQWLFFDGPL